MLQIALSYLAGIATLLNPCVLPLIPIVLASALQGGRRGPAALAAGLGLATAGAGFFVTVFGRALGISASDLTFAGAVMLLVFGALILAPARFSPLKYINLHGLAARIGGHGTGFAAGAALGLAWSPCIGPTMGAAIALAATGQNLGFAGAVMLAYGAGIATLMLALGYGAGRFLTKERLRRLAPYALRSFGATCLVLGLALLTHAHIALEIWAVEHLPDWMLTLSTTL